MNDYRPRIGIAMRIELETERFYLSRHYSEAVEAAGAAPLHISLVPDPEYISAIVEGLDGIILPGSGSDVDPQRYGRDPLPGLRSVHPIKDETDLLVLQEAEEKGVPIFGICFGMQILNVSRGGTLIQDVGSQLPSAIKHEQGQPRDRRSHGVKLLEGSLVSSLAGGNNAFVNSHHHQAIETVGRDLVATAWTSDGLIEAVEDPRADRFVMAVQWHPELGWKQDDLSQALFGRFVSECAEYARTIAKARSNSEQVI